MNEMTITLPRAIVEQALEALGLAKLNGKAGLHPAEIGEIADAITELRAALAQQAETEEPVAWRVQRSDGQYEVYLASAKRASECYIKRPQIEPLYAAPPQRKPLTEEDEIMDAVREADLDWQAGWTLDEHEPNRFTTLVRAIERAHGIKEKQ